MISNEKFDYLKTHQTFAQLTREAFDQLARHIPFRKIAKDRSFFMHRTQEITFGLQSR